MCRQVDLPAQDEVGITGDGARGAFKPARSHRILHFHHNVPGVMSEINPVMADLGINITGQYLKTIEAVG